jgi:inorganic pyrophosphatase/exopolyphosphatase
MGSASSLLALLLMNDQHLFTEDLVETHSGSPGIAYLLSAAVCIDTKFFHESIKGKIWCEDDYTAYKFLLKYGNFTKKEGMRIYKERENVSKDLSHGIESLFVKDYKTFTLRNANQHVVGNVACAVMRAPLEDIFDTYG